MAIIHLVDVFSTHFISNNTCVVWLVTIARHDVYAETNKI